MVLRLKAKTQKKLQKPSADNRTKAATIGQSLGVDLSKLIQILSKNKGVGLVSIRRLIPMDKEYNGNIQIWSPEVPDGHMYGTKVKRDDDIDIVVQGGHAYAVVPSDSFSPEYREPQNCLAKCWKRYEGSGAQAVHELSRQRDPRCGELPYRCPKQMAIIQHNMRMFGLLPKMKLGQRQFRWNLLIGKSRPELAVPLSLTGAREESDINTILFIPMVQTIETMKEAIEKFKEGPAPQGDMIRLLEVVDTEFGLRKAFVIVFDNDEESKYLRTVLGDLAKYGLLIAIPGDMYRRLRSQNIQRARQYVKDFTKHNDKLGFDFSVPDKKYKVGYTKHFSSSQYKGFLEQASEFYKDAYPELSAHYKRASEKFTIGDKERDRLIEKTAGPFIIP